MDNKSNVLEGLNIDALEQGVMIEDVLSQYHMIEADEHPSTDWQHTLTLCQRLHIRVSHTMDGTNMGYRFPGDREMQYFKAKELPFEICKRLLRMTQEGHIFPTNEEEIE